MGVPEGKRREDRLEDYLARIGYRLNTSKTHIQPLTEPVPWLGYTYQLTERGKVIVRMKPEKYREHMRRLRRMRKAADAGRMTRAAVDAVYESYRSELVDRHVTRKQVVKFEQFYRDLWR